MIEHHHHPRQASLEPSTNQYGILLNKSIPARALARAAPGLRLKAIPSVGCRIRLQTSCWVLQLRVQAEPAAGFRVPVVGPTTTQAFWQFMACVSQVPEQDVDACGEIKGVGVSGTGWTSPGVTICPGTACASRIRSSARAVEMSNAAIRIESCRTYLIEASIWQGKSSIRCTANAKGRHSQPQLLGIRRHYVGADCRIPRVIAVTF